MESWADVVVEMLGNAGGRVKRGAENVYDTVSRGASDFSNNLADELFYSRVRERLGIPNQPEPERVMGDVGPYQDQEAGDRFKDQQFENAGYAMGAPGRILDRASEFYTGRPAFGVDRPMERALAPVSAGVSQNETDKAQTKLMSAVAENEARHGEIQNAQLAEAKMRLAKLLEASQAAPEDVFVDVGGKDKGQFGMLRGVNKPLTHGSFSRSDKPIAEYDKQNGLSPEELTGLGANPLQSRLLSQISREDNPSKANSLAMVMKLLPRSITSNEKVLAILDEAMKSKDPIGAEHITKAMLKVLGHDQDYIDQLFNGAKP